MSGQIYVFSGPSGAGKSTLIKALRERVPKLGYSVSHTSRAPRHNEINGVDYHFVDREGFNRMIEKGAFVEWANVYHDLYGTSFSGLIDQVDQDIDVILDLDIQGAKNIREHFKDSVLTYILPPSLKVLEKRLRERDTDDGDIIDTRIESAYDELKSCTWYDYIIVNKDLQKAVGDAESIIRSDRRRTSRAFPRIKEMLNL